MTKSLAKTLIILSAILLLALFITGIVQSFQISSLKSQEALAKQKNNEMIENVQEVQDEIDYNNSDDYYKDYYELEEKYGQEGDKIYEIK